MKIAIIPNLDKINARDTVSGIIDVLKCINIYALLPIEIGAGNTFGCKTCPEADIYEEADIVIAVGGDGTIIRTAKRAAEHGKLVLGVNSGRIGFMAGLEQSELEYLKKLKTGDYDTENRMLLDAKLINTVTNEILGEYHCLNDAVISKGALSRIMDITLDCNSELIQYRSDGLIVATPTGSTAYSMSAGGPVVDPSVEGMIITPICPHSFFARSILLNADSKIIVSADNPPDTKAYLTVDGEEAFELKHGYAVKITKSDLSVRLIKLKKDSFYRTLSRKLM